jgi:hypothetical protein
MYALKSSSVKCIFPTAPLVTSARYVRYAPIGWTRRSGSPGLDHSHGRLNTLESSPACLISTANSGGCRAYSVLLRTRKVPMMPGKSDERGRRMTKRDYLLFGAMAAFVTCWSCQVHVWEAEEHMWQKTPSLGEKCAQLFDIVLSIATLAVISTSCMGAVYENADTGSPVCSAGQCPRNRVESLSGRYCWVLDNISVIFNACPSA